MTSHPTRVTKGLLERLVQRLVTAGVLVESTTDLLRLRRWPIADREPKDEIRRRLQSCLLGGAQPTERTAALVSLLEASGRLSAVVQPHDVIAKRAIQTRAKSLCDGDWAGAAIKTAIAERANGLG